MKLIAIIPAFNEESTIGDVIKATSRFVDEILVINDGSTDNTSDIAKSAGATVIDNIVNRGLGKTIKRSAYILLQIDTDGQTGFRAIRKELFEKIALRGDFTYMQEVMIKASKEGWRIAANP